MLRFAQFIQEKFLKGMNSAFGYAEIYENPTSSEMLEISDDNPNFQIGAIIAGKKLYAWNRDDAQHLDVRHQIPNDPEFLPLYLYYDFSRGVTVELSEFTMSAVGRKGYNTPEGVTAIRARILTNPALKKLGPITIRPWTRA